MAFLVVSMLKNTCLASEFVWGLYSDRHEIYDFGSVEFSERVTPEDAYEISVYLEQLLVTLPNIDIIVYSYANTPACLRLDGIIKFVCGKRKIRYKNIPFEYYTIEKLNDFYCFDTKAVIEEKGLRNEHTYKTALDMFNSAMLYIKEYKRGLKT